MDAAMVMKVRWELEGVLADWEKLQTFDDVSASTIRRVIAALAEPAVVSQEADARRYRWLRANAITGSIGFGGIAHYQ